MRFKSGRFVSPVVIGVLFAMTCCLALLALPFVRYAGGAVPAIPIYHPCERVVHAMKKAGSQGVMTTGVRDSLFQELGAPSLPIEDDNGYKYCWRCSKPCPQGQGQDENWGCIWMNSDWRVTGHTVPECKREEELLKGKAQNGDAAAQADLGALYEEGKGVPQNYREALKWYRKAAERGNADGQYRLGLMYEDGKGVSRDNQEALKWYRKASDNGNSRAPERVRALTATVRNKTDTRTPDAGWQPPTPDELRAMKRPAPTSPNVCTSARYLIERLAEGVESDDKKGRIDMGYIGQVTYDQGISMQWRSDMLRLVTGEPHGRKVDELSMAIFRASQAVRLCIKQKKENDLRNSRYDLDNPATTFDHEVELIRKECPGIQVPSTLVKRMEQCRSRPQPKLPKCEDMLNMVNKVTRWQAPGASEMYIDDKISASAVQAKFGPSSCNDSGRMCWKCQRQNGSVSYFTVTPGHAAVGLTDCNCQ